MIRAHEIPNNGNSYWVEDTHKGNGLAVGAISTAVPAAVISLANLAKEWLAGKGSSTTADNVAAFTASLAPVLSTLLGKAVSPGTALNPDEVKLAEQAAKIAMLESENYSDKGDAELNKAITQGQKDQFEYSLGLERRIGKLEGENACLTQRFADYKEAAKEKELLEKQIVDGKITRVSDSVACLAGQLDQTNQALNATNARIAAITKIVIPGDVVCGDSGGKCATGNKQ